MKYITLLLSTLFLTSCTSTNDRFYEDVWKPRPKIIIKDLASTDETPAEDVVAENPVTPLEPKVEFIRVEVLNPVYQGIKYLDYTEKENRSELKELTGVDPVRIEWCAAYVNAILEESQIPSNKDHKYPLTARAFLDWGNSVDTPVMGDVVVFPRGEAWQGHVGFYVKEQMIDGVLYYYILGGNQNNSVTVKLFRADKALGIRRHS